MTIKKKILFFITIIGAWQLLYFLSVDVLKTVSSYTLPSPMGVAVRFVELVTGNTLIKAVLYSVGRGIAGYIISVILGIVLGLAINGSHYFKYNFRSLILGIQTLPSVCWVPFAILWFGLSIKAILFVVIMGSAFSIAIAVDNAIDNVLPIYKRAALTMGANKKQLYTLVILPAALPEIVGGLRQGWAFAWRALMSGEVMITSISLGQTLIMGRDYADINQVALVMIIIILIGMLIEKCIFSKLQADMMRKRGLIQE